MNLFSQILQRNSLVFDQDLEVKQHFTGLYLYTIDINQSIRDEDCYQFYNLLNRSVSEKCGLEPSLTQSMFGTGTMM